MRRGQAEYQQKERTAPACRRLQDEQSLISSTLRRECHSGTVFFTHGWRDEVTRTELPGAEDWLQRQNDLQTTFAGVARHSAEAIMLIFATMITIKRPAITIIAAMMDIFDAMMTITGSMISITAAMMDIFAAMMTSSGR
jgi:hypothetical protein